MKQRTLARELETVQQMLEVAQVKVEIQNELDTASISPILESALAMVSLELATNMTVSYTHLVRPLKELRQLLPKHQICFLY